MKTLVKKMTLTDIQIENTKKELKSNFEKSGLTIKQISDDLKTSPEYIEELFNLNSKRLEDTWILRNYLIEVLNEKSINITPFTALKGDASNYWFLDANYINNKIIL